MLSVLTAFLVRVRLLVNRVSARLGFGDDGFLVVAAILIGIVTAAAAVSFHELINLIRNWLYGQMPSVDLYGRHVWLLLVFPAAGGLAVGGANWFFTRRGGAAGHGVVDVMETVTRASGWLRPLAAVESLLTSAMTIGTGGSAGAEGPIVQIGAAIASGFGRAFAMARSYVPVLVGCGTAAGISAIFNSPIGGVIFTLEVILYDFSIRAFLPIVLASVIANVTTHAIFEHIGEGTSHAIFRVSPYITAGPGMAGAGPTPIQALNWPSLPSFVLLGIACGLVGVTTTRLMYKTDELFRKLPVPKPVRPAIGGLLLGVLGVSYVLILGHLLLDRIKPIEHYPMPAFFGDGYGVIQQLFDAGFYSQFFAHFGVGKLAVLLAILIGAKVLGTCLTLSSGGSGGIIAPSLFLGATTGALLGLGFEHAHLAAGVQVGFYALVGMGAVLAAVVHAPLASILILFEVTQERGVVLPAMLATIVATGLARLIFPDSVYTLSLRRRGVKVGTSSDLRILRRLTVDQVQLEPAASVTSETPFDELVKRTADSGTRDFVVFDKSGNYAGLVTADEVREALLSPESIPLLLAGEVVRGDVPCVRSGDDLATVLETFSRFEVGRLPVCVASNPGHVIGLISRGALMRRYHKALLEG
jgi:CIC family chloride channel protein